VLDFRVAGVTFEQIGRQLGITKQAAHKHYRRAMAEAQQRTAELSEELTELTRRRLDALVSAHWISKADPRSAEVIIRVEALRMRLEGTEAPARLEHSGKDGKPIEVAHTVMPLEFLSDEDLATLKEIARRAAVAAPSAPADVHPTVTA
jgi:hypothetical protein